MADQPERNWLLPLLGVGAVLFTAVLVFIAGRGEVPERTRAADSATSEQAELAPDRDNPSDVFGSLRGDAARIEERIDTVLAENERLKARNERLETAREEDAAQMKELLESGIEGMDTRQADFTSALGEQLAGLNAGIDSQVTQIEERLRQIETDGLALRAEELQEAERRRASGEVVPATDSIDIVWVARLDERAEANGRGVSDEEGADQGGGSAAQTTSGLATGGLLRRGNAAGGDSSVTQQAASGAAGLDPNVRSSLIAANTPPPVPAAIEPDPETVPYYTLPDLSTLGGAEALTALFGRVYFDEEIVNPFEIKVSAGLDNLTANFHTLPDEIEGMTFGGYAVGNRALECVEGIITSATFVFRDGTVRSAYLGDPGSRPENDAYPDGRIGYLTDAYGNQCIPGTAASDAPKIFAWQAGLAGAQGYASALRQQEVETSVFAGDGGGATVIENVTGNALDFARASAYAEGIDQATQWLQRYYDKPFAAVYVPPGKQVAINLTQELRLDKEPNARLLRYNRDTTRHARFD